MYHLSDTCLPPDYGTPGGSRLTASDSSTHRLRNAGGTYGLSFACACAACTPSRGRGGGEYALAVLLPPLSRPSSSPSPPSALASGTGRVWSSQLIRRGAGARCGPRGLSRHNKINSQAHGGHRASRSTDVASASLASSQRIPYCAN